MPDRRGVRSASRRKTPTPQSPSKTNTPLGGRASRTRALRSASRDVEPAPKPTRRSARQASIATDDSDHEGTTPRKADRASGEGTVADLTIIQEVDTQVELDEIPGTPDHDLPDPLVPFRSPGAASEMSGTTAISSFSMVEADFLEPRYILKHLRKLCDAADEFLEHLAPDQGSIEVDLQHIHEIQKPDAEFTEDYRDFNNELMVHLGHFKTEGNSYIHIRALHRALFGINSEAVAAQSGVDLVLYLANLIIFAKQMIHSDRHEKEIWDALRQLDNFFPSQFMRSLDQDTDITSAGESALLNDTFEMALELRTQLAILVLERSGGDDGFNPDDVLSDVFLSSEASQAATGSLSRGWSIAALGGEDVPLPRHFEDEIAKRITTIRESCGLHDESLEPGAIIDLDGLSANFPWEATILRLLHWVRLRHRELSEAVKEMGGSSAIVFKVKHTLEVGESIAQQLPAPFVPQESPRRKRKSFGRDRRRSGRKFDPNAPIDIQAIDALKARERLSNPTASEPEPAETEEANAGDVEVEAQIEPLLPTASGQGVADQPEIVDLENEPLEPIYPQLPEVVAEPIEEQENEADEVPSGPPTSSMAMLKALKAVSRPEKENRTTSLFERQENAQRVEFGDGFDTQPTPGPSNRDKGKQRAVPSPSKKRARVVDVESEDDEDAFQTDDRTARIQARREQAPVAKKVRIDPSSSGAPPSHQPPPRSSREDEVSSAPEPEQEEGSMSEPEAPDMTEEAPPPSTYRAQHSLAMQNRAIQPTQRERKQRTAWSYEEEEAFAEYMSMFPAKYSAILNYDKQEGGGILQERTQVNLKDKARTMAINMIKSGTGLKAGFEDVVKPTNKDGRMLLDQGYTW